MNRPWSCHGYTRRTRRSGWRKNNASNRKYNTGKGAIPWRGPGAQYKRERNEKEKTTKKQRHSQGERQRARARTGTSANERKPEEARQQEQNQGPGQGQGQRKRNKASKQTSMERVSTRRKGKRERRQRKRITSAVNRQFTSLVQGPTETDLCFLLDESSWRNGVYTYDHEAKRCITCESVPRPVAWVLGRFNLKHRHVHKPPSAESVRERCVDLERKVLWRWHRDTKGFLDGDAPWRISNMPVAEYPKTSFARAQALVVESPTSGDGSF